MSYQRYQRGKEQHTTTNVDNEGKNEFLEIQSNKEAKGESVTENNPGVTVAKLLGQVTLKGATFLNLA